MVRNAVIKSSDDQAKFPMGGKTLTNLSTICKSVDDDHSSRQTDQFIYLGFCNFSAWKCCVVRMYLILFFE